MESVGLPARWAATAGTAIRLGAAAVWPPLVLPQEPAALVAMIGSARPPWRAEWFSNRRVGHTSKHQVRGHLTQVLSLPPLAVVGPEQPLQNSASTCDV